MYSQWKSWWVNIIRSFGKSWRRTRANATGLAKRPEVRLGYSECLSLCMEIVNKVLKAHVRRHPVVHSRDEAPLLRHGLEPREFSIYRVFPGDKSCLVDSPDKADTLPILLPEMDYVRTAPGLDGKEAGDTGIQPQRN